MGDLHGIADKAARFVEEKQLMKAENWKLFVDLFNGTPDDKDDGWRCEYFGKMMRGASVTYGYTKSEELYSLLTETAERMLKTQDDLGRFSTYSVEKEFNGWDMWGRKYVLLGFLYYYDICRDEGLKSRILSALCRHLDYIVAHIGDGKKGIGETSEAWKCVNSASILEPTLMMYKLTNNGSYLDFAKYIIDYLYNSEACIFKCAEEDKLDPYLYPVNKAYEVMSCFEGLLRYYELTGEERWLNVVEKFVRRLKNSDITVIGCAGCFYEQFDNSAATQTDADRKGIMQETCVTVTWMKLCNLLLNITGDSQYADEIERSAYNALYGAVNTLNRRNKKGEDFVFDSYSPLLLNRRSREVGGYKDIAENKYYGCCVAIGAHGTGMVPLNAARSVSGGIAIDFYEAGHVEKGGFKLSINTEYPIKGDVTVTVVSAPSDVSKIKFRIPGFTRDKATVSLNGEAMAENNGYAEIERVWQVGDKVELKFDMSLRIIRPRGVEGKPQTEKFIALAVGPLVLARDARIGEVGSAIKASNTASYESADKKDFPCNLLASVTVGDTTFKMIDYMSAGKTWDEESLTEVFIPIE